MSLIDLSLVTDPKAKALSIVDTNNDSDVNDKRVAELLNAALKTHGEDLTNPKIFDRVRTTLYAQMKEFDDNDKGDDEDAARDALIAASIMQKIQQAKKENQNTIDIKYSDIEDMAEDESKAVALPFRERAILEAGPYDAEINTKLVAAVLKEYIDTPEMKDKPLDEKIMLLEKRRDGVSWWNNNMDGLLSGSWRYEYAISALKKEEEYKKAAAKEKEAEVAAGKAKETQKASMGTTSWLKDGLSN